MSITFRLLKKIKDDSANFSIGCCALHNFRKSLAEAIGFKEWVACQEYNIKQSFEKTPLFKDPPLCSWGYFANGFDSFCNQSDCEGKVKIEDMDSLCHLFGAVTCIPPFNGNPRRLVQESPLDKLREDFETLAKKCLAYNSPLIWE